MEQDFIKRNIEVLFSLFTLLSFAPTNISEIELKAGAGGGEKGREGGGRILPVFFS